MKRTKTRKKEKNFTAHSAARVSFKKKKKKFRIKATNSQLLNTFLFDYSQMWSENFLLCITDFFVSVWPVHGDEKGGASKICRENKGENAQITN